MAEQVTQSPEETYALATKLVRIAAFPGAVWALYGDLGAGKTCFVKGTAAALNVKQPVSSPTYTLINEYAGDLSIYHIDLYRLHSTEDILAIGLDEYIESQGLTILEWAERADGLLPAHTLHIRLNYGAHPEERVISWNEPRDKVT